MSGPPSRRAGILVPLFSIPSSRSWGIGEIADIVPMSRWLEAAGQRLLQLLPINEMPPGETVAIRSCTPAIGRWPSSWRSSR